MEPMRMKVAGKGFEDGKEREVEAVPVPNTQGALAVQRSEMIDGEILWMALHVPTGRLMGNYAFEDQRQAIEKLQLFWNELGAHDRLTLMVPMSPAEVSSNQAIKQALRRCFVQHANVKVCSVK